MSILESVGLHMAKKVIDAVWSKVSSHPKPVEPPEPSIYDQIKRFKRVMVAHGMRLEHWARFFKECDAPFSIKRSDQVDDDALIKWIDDEKIGWLCETFRIHRSWMDGESSSRPHDAIYFNKRPEKFFETITRELERKPNILADESGSAIFAINTDERDCEENKMGHLLFAVGIPICRLSSELTVYRYILDDASGGYPWHHEPYRSHVKILARLCHLHFEFFINGLSFSRKQFDAVDNGDRLLPEALAEPGHHHISWHPEDYALAECESCAAREADQLPKALLWMEQLGLPHSRTSQRIP